MQFLRRDFSDVIIPPPSIETAKLTTYTEVDEINEAAPNILEIPLIPV